MPLEKDVLDIEKQLRKVIRDNEDSSTATDLLSRLGQCSITKEVLRKTNIANLVSSLGKSTTDENVRTQSKNLLLSWKKTVNVGGKMRDALVTPEHLDSGGHDDSIEEDILLTESDTESTGEMLLDPVRNKCREMLSNALKCDLNPSLVTAAALGASIETAIYNMFNDTGQKYKNHVKSRILNLKDRRNNQLRHSVLNGIVTPQQLAHMTTKELACEDLRRERESQAEESLKEHRLPVDSTSNTGKYCCNKCGSRDTSYSQVQVGMKDDDSLMTFVSCNKCGRKWKGEHLEYGSADVEEFEIT